jgi:hypothetical protein
LIDSHYKSAGSEGNKETNGKGAVGKSVNHQMKTLPNIVMKMKKMILMTDEPSIDWMR